MNIGPKYSRKTRQEDFAASPQRRRLPKRKATCLSETGNYLAFDLGGKVNEEL